MWTFLYYIFASLFFIILLHYFWEYIKKTYSTKKTKDLIKTQVNQYEKIIKEMHENIEIKKTEINQQTEILDMENDLAIFLDQTINTL